MSKSDTETIHVIHLPVDATYKVINVKKNDIHKELIIITWVSEKEYQKLKHGEELWIRRGNQDFYINPDDIFCFGDINFNEGSKDCDELDTFNWLDNLVAKGIGIPSNYNYDKHECKSKFRFYQITETFKNSVLCRYFHACLGKPQYTLIFREMK